MPRTSLSRLLIVLAGVLLATGCATESTDGAGITLEDGGSYGTAPNLDEPTAPDTGLGDDPAPTSDQVVQAALRDVGAFWSRTYEDLYGEPFQPLRGGYWPYGPSTELPPCGDPPPTYADIAQNAFYCPTADLIAWDDVALVPSLYDEFGGFTLGIVFAHEFGHAIQVRAGTQGPTILLELQADCFAGAWAADVATGSSDFFELSLADLDKAVEGFLALRDGVGTTAADPAAHGTGFDRIGSFAEGYQHGAARCAEFPDDYARGDLVVVEVPFTNPTDFEMGGNLPLDELEPLLRADLESFWSQLFAARGETWTPVQDILMIEPAVDDVTCGDRTFRGEVLENASFFCAASDTIYLDGQNLVPTLDQIGDYAVATEIARQYAFAAQARLGILDDTLATNLQADCLAGLYAHSGFVGDREGTGQRLSLSPGDLDEAVVAFLLNSDAGEDVDARDDSVGTAFQRFDAYRTGFVEGAEACDALLDEG